MKELRPILAARWTANSAPRAASTRRPGAWPNRLPALPAGGLRGSPAT